MHLDATTCVMKLAPTVVCGSTFGVNGVTISPSTGLQ